MNLHPNGGNSKESLTNLGTSLISGSSIKLQGVTLVVYNTWSMGAASGTLQAFTQNADGNYINGKGEKTWI